MNMKHEYEMSKCPFSHFCMNGFLSFFGLISKKYFSFSFRYTNKRSVHPPMHQLVRPFSSQFKPMRTCLYIVASYGIIWISFILRKKICGVFSARAYAHCNNVEKHHSTYMMNRVFRYK